VTLPIPLDPVVETVLHQGDLDHAVYEDTLRIVQAIDACLHAAGVAPGAIQSVFLTGGSTAVPEIRRQVLGHLPNAKPVTGDLFGSVGLGLAIDAARKFA
jgi:hypothetical chaperone protein